MLKWMYCGLDQVVWSAPVDSLDNWRFDGIIFESKTDGNGNLLREMATVKPGTEVISLMPGFEEEGIERFFEASSIRKIKDKYVFIYSRMTKDGEWGLPQTIYTLAYAYSDNPLGPYTYGGTMT